MPKGMILRSTANWYLDPDHQWTIDRFLAAHNPNQCAGEPISREQYIAYMNWFIQQADIPITPAYVRRLDQEEHWFTAELDNGQTIRARNVVLAVGFQYFTHLPEPLVSLLPAGRYQHTCDAVDMTAFLGKRVLLIGGRQSAFESAALLREAGAAHIHLSYRHATPRFEEADWSWVEPIVDHMAKQPTWFRNLSTQQQEQYRYRLWAEGRLKVEPWLKERVCQPEISLHPHTEIASTRLKADDSICIGLTNGQELSVDNILLATGYQVDVAQLPFLSESIQQALATQSGFPLLNPHFQSSVPGLYFSSFAAGQSFGPFFGFTVGVRTAANLIGHALLPASVTSDSADSHTTVLS